VRLRIEDDDTDNEGERRVMPVGTLGTVQSVNHTDADGVTFTTSSGQRRLDHLVGRRAATRHPYPAASSWRDGRCVVSDERFPGDDADDHRDGRGGRPSWLAAGDRVRFLRPDGVITTDNRAAASTPLCWSPRMPRTTQSLPVLTEHS
jgi:hypothetical protein